MVNALIIDPSFLVCSSMGSASCPHLKVEIIVPISTLKFHLPETCFYVASWWLGSQLSVPIHTNAHPYTNRHSCIWLLSSATRAGLHAWTPVCTAHTCAFLVRLNASQCTALGAWQTGYNLSFQPEHHHFGHFTISPADVSWKLQFILILYRLLMSKNILMIWWNDFYSRCYNRTLYWNLKLVSPSLNFVFDFRGVTSKPWMFWSWHSSFSSCKEQPAFH